MTDDRRTINEAPEVMADGYYGWSPEQVDAYWLKRRRVERTILDALHACVTGEFKVWSEERHESVASLLKEHPNVAASAVERFLDEQAPGRICPF